MEQDLTAEEALLGEIDYLITAWEMGWYIGLGGQSMFNQDMIRIRALRAKMFSEPTKPEGICQT